MKHVHEPTSGSIAANHRHAFTNESFNYLANFDPHGSEIEWAAKVRFQDDVVGELRGNATLAGVVFLRAECAALRGCGAHRHRTERGASRHGPDDHCA